MLSLTFIHLTIFTSAAFGAVIPRQLADSQAATAALAELGLAAPVGGQDLASLIAAANTNAVNAGTGEVNDNGGGAKGKAKDCKSKAAKGNAKDAKGGANQQQAQAIQLGQSSADGVGAVYFMTNDAASNMIVASQMNKDGTLTPVSATATGGKGGVGTVDPPAAEHADALFTQDAITVRGNMLFAVNAGSNTLTMMAIDPTDPTKLTLAAQAQTGGDFPTAVAVNKDCTNACVVNSGSASNMNCFAVGKTSLTALPNAQRSLGLNQTAVPAGPGGTVSDVVFMNNGNVAVSVKGTSATAPGNVQLFSMTGSGDKATVGAAATVVPAAAGGALPFSMSVPLDGSNTLFATDAAAGVSTFNLDGVKASADAGANATGAATSTLTAITGQGATCWSAQSPVTKSFFTSDVLTSQITEFSSVNGAAATQVMTYPMANTTGTIDLNVASTKGGDFLVVNGAMAKSLITMSVGTQPGQAKMVQQVDMAAALKGKVNLTANMQGAAVFVKA